MKFSYTISFTIALAIAINACQDETEDAVTGVSLDAATLNLKVAGAKTLTATVMPATAKNKEVRWHSSKTSVATVSTTGRVIAIAPGETTITVITDEGSKTAVCAVTVILPVESITIDPASLSLVVNAKATLNPVFIPAEASNKKVSWKSENPSVATVSDQGEVTGVGDGTTTITAATEDGNKTSSATVHVISWGMVLAGGQALPDEFELARYGAVALQIGGTPPLPVVTWSSSDENKATVSDQGLVSGVAAGDVVISATAPNGSSGTVNIKVIYENYKGDFKTTEDAYYYITIFQTTGGNQNINYAYADPVPPAKPERYVYAPGTAPSGGLTLSKRTGEFTIEVVPKYDDSIIGLWIDWNIDGYFSGGSEKPYEDTEELYYVGTPLQDNAGRIRKRIAIPKNAIIGKLRMRVQNTWKGSDETAPQLYPDNGDGWWLKSGTVRDFDVEITE